MEKQAKGRPAGRTKRMSSQHLASAHPMAEQASYIAVPVLDFGLMDYVRVDVEAYRSSLRTVTEDSI